MVGCQVWYQYIYYHHKNVNKCFFYVSVCVWGGGGMFHVPAKYYLFFVIHSCELCISMQSWPSG